MPILGRLLIRMTHITSYALCIGIECTLTTAFMSHATRQQILHKRKDEESAKNWTCTSS